MTGRPPNYTSEMIIAAFEELRSAGVNDVNVNKVRTALNGGNRERIKRVLEEYEGTQGRGVPADSARATARRVLEIEESVRTEAGAALAGHMESVMDLIGRAAEAERLKEKQSADAAKAAFEHRLRERDTEIEDLRGVISDSEQEANAAYEAAAYFKTQRDALERERDRLASEAERLAAENARLAGAVGPKRAKKAGKENAPKAPGTSVDDRSQAPQRHGSEEEAPSGADDTTVIQSVMFAAEAEPARVDGGNAAMPSSGRKPAPGHRKPRRNTEQTGTAVSTPAEQRDPPPDADRLKRVGAG